MDNTISIYNTSMNCRRLFERILCNKEAASFYVVEMLDYRFKQWASYLGVFAQENISLDARLQYSTSVSELVLDFLRIVLRNLEHIDEVEGTLKLSNAVGEDLQQWIDQDINNRPTSDISHPLVDSLQAVKLSMDGLYRLGAAIRQSSSSTLNQRIIKYSQDNEDRSVENMVFLRLKHTFFDRKQQENSFKSPLSLYKQLALSINFRYFRLLYGENRQYRMEKDREDAPSILLAQSQQENTNPKKKEGPNYLRKLAIAKNDPKTSEDIPSSVNTQSVHQRYVASDKSFAQSMTIPSTDVMDIKYPDAPRVNPLTKEAKCPFCRKLISEKELSEVNGWRLHLQQDLKLFTCLSEQCAEPPQFFIQFRDWKQHMDEMHTMDWPKKNSHAYWLVL
ncbi:hypothetical protein V8C34DRAFT_285580 [Trichoderma compactum]